MFNLMDTPTRPDDLPVHPVPVPVPVPETEDEKRRRMSWEAERIAEADAEIAAGLYVDADEIDAWLDSIGTDHQLPPPRTRHR